MNNSLLLLLKLVVSKGLLDFHIFFIFLTDVLFCLDAHEVLLVMDHLFRLVWIAQILIIIYANFQYVLIVRNLFVLMILGFLSLELEIIVFFWQKLNLSKKIISHIWWNSRMIYEILFWNFILNTKQFSEKNYSKLNF